MIGQTPLFKLNGLDSSDIYVNLEKVKPSIQLERVGADFIPYQCRVDVINDSIAVKLFQWHRCHFKLK